MRIGKYQFKPRLIPSLLVVVLFPLLLRLGFWQLARADQKRVILANQHAKMDLPPLPIVQRVGANDDLEYRHLQVSGTFLDKYQIFIDNKVSQGQAGYDVVTPLRIKQTNQVVLVDRGWVPLGNSRAELPHIDTPDQEVTLTGIADYHTKDVVSFGAANRSNQGWPAVVRWVDIQEIQAETKLDLAPFMLLLDPKERYGFVRNWQFVNMPPAKHVSYAVQWFTMALVLLVIYIVVNTKRIHESGTQDE
ncbi:MAG: hypothetical protein GC149_09050 [Gammaproteobacteria bacterium]|nr:hypothetical protein [Gammaproteobacteria bacterium]